MKFKVEVRDIKTSVVVFLSVLVSKLVHLEYPFFTAIAAIFTIESTKDTPLAAGRIRLLGSVVGALVGIGFAFIQPGNAVLCGFGMMVVIYLCSIFNLDKAIPIAGVIFMAIMLSPDMKDPLRYSVSRIANTFIGISIAVIIDYLIPSGRKAK
jgi:uncharacterized membrane protein YgaE (UPF0421/DUF939 family)